MAKRPLTRDLQFEKKNQDMVKLPKYARIQKRPIPHPPIASPYAGPSTPKTVYISSSTPFMSAVKRVQKLLHQTEKRAMASVHLSLSNKTKTDRQKLAQMAEGHEKMRKEAGQEEIFIKATGRAMEKAMRVGKWFGEREREYVTRVKTGSVIVVDDVVEDEEGRKKVVEEGEKIEKEGEEKKKKKKEEEESGDTESAGSKSAAKKRKRAAAAETEELPESRTRWVNVVEIAVTYK
ncbi:ribonuclease P subunit p20 family protein [Aspergillus ruber CBS 135680]|uniref:Uncharacterized protein n=1 Tax=Aspergillus ruber (strain CBS 135680) TaxID=1388766 RepID=A0A017SMH6_ASPRC|nr:uncharacterized protein EURHEDRAFT_449593 [Aspergillus ruber CBS 135680]EYE98142.1 hypothetical protein EURHEDRAFT_449593 [Aspergillus ruber CBS 135680]